MKKLFVFLDETGVSDRPPVRRTWARKGRTPVITVACGWKTRSVIGALVCEATGHRPRLFFMVRATTVRSADIIRYLKELKRQIGRRKAVLVWDGLAAHRSSATRSYLQTASDWLTVERFPTYAPELNPVEYIWSSFKNRDAPNRAPETVRRLDHVIRTGLRRIGRNPGILSGCLQASSLFH